MSIANIVNSESGISVRNKLNSLIERHNIDTVVLGNGTASENHTELQTAITAASSGDVILVKPGTYGVSASSTLTGKSGVILIGTNPDTTEILGNFTVNGLATVMGLTIEGVETGAATTNFEECFIRRNPSNGKIKFTSSGSTVTFKKCEFEYDISQPAFSIANSTIEFNYCQVPGFKLLATGTSKVTVRKCDGTFNAGGGYTMRAEDTSTLTFFDTNLLMADSNGDLSEGAGYLQMQIVDNAKMFADNLRYDNILKVYNDATAEVRNYVSMWSGRFDASADATANAFIKATNFYLHMDNGFDNGSHNIEVTLGNTLPTFEFNNGVIEYMGDQGQYPMVGNASAGGGVQRWNNVTLIDHGSALNAASTAEFPGGFAYDHVSVYGNDDAIYTNCNFYWGAVHNPNAAVPAQTQGMIQLKVNSNDFVRCHVNNCRISVLQKSERAAFLATELGETLSSEHDIVINAQISNAPLASSDQFARDFIETRLKRRALVGQTNQIFTDLGHISNLELDKLSKETRLPRVTVQSSSNAYVDVRNNISTTDLNAIINDGEMLLGTGTQGTSRKNLNLALPKRFTKGQGTINIQLANGSYPNGYIEAVNNEPLTYLRVENAHIVVEDGTTGKYFVYQLSNGAPTSADTMGVNANTPVQSQILATEYYILYEANTGNQTLGYNCHASASNYLVLDAGFDRIQTPMYAEFLIKVNANFTGNQDGSIYKVTYSNLYRGSSTAPQTSISVDIVSEGLSAAYKLTPANITSDEYVDDTLRKRYARIGITGVNSNSCLSFDFLQAYNVVDGYLINIDEEA